MIYKPNNRSSSSSHARNNAPCSFRGMGQEPVEPSFCEAATFRTELERAQLRQKGEEACFRGLCPLRERRGRSEIQRAGRSTSGCFSSRRRFCSPFLSISGLAEGGRDDTTVHSARNRGAQASLTWRSTIAHTHHPSRLCVVAHATLYLLPMRTSTGCECRSYGGLIQSRLCLEMAAGCVSK